jgi:Tol biopolymer transport system component
MPLAPGTHLGQYEILDALGAGGMGEVYRARDPRLGRDVAIKVLSPALAAHPAALVRFEREAMTIARLSHPNIVSVYEFGRDGATTFVVMELVDGETLRAKLTGRPMPVRRAVAYGLAIVRGIAAAHARGIVHRDLKPENVMITRDDQVRLLDFGLARSVVDEADQTRTGHVTEPGTILGTVGYMAPEQVRGLAVDHRADLFAFGAILYEMLTGARAFLGETAADTMTAILTKDPPEPDLALAIPPGLDRIVRRCLEKPIEQRFQSANDLAFALETLTTITPSSGVAALSPAARPPGRAWLPWGVAALAAGAALAAWTTLGRPEAPTRWATFTRVTEAAGEETAPAISPDGSTVLFAARTNGNWDLYAQRVGGRNASAVVNDPERHESGPAFSPDGARIAFHESDALGGIFVAGATGESVRRLTDAGFHPAWSPDSAWIAYSSNEIVDPASRQGSGALFVVAASGGTPRRVVEGDASQPWWSPTGARIAYWSNTAGRRDIYTVGADGGARVAVTDDEALDWGPFWADDGFIYFSSDRGGAMNIWRVRVDSSSGAVSGAPEPITSGVPAAADLPRLAAGGSRLVFRSRVATINPVAVPIDPATLRAGEPYLLDTQSNIRVPSDVSPDGRHIAYFNIGERQEDIFLGEIGGPMRRLTDDPARDRAPVFMPDGRSLVFYSNREGSWAAWAIDLDGGNLRRIPGGEGAIYPSISRDGTRLSFINLETRRAATWVPLGSAAQPPAQTRLETTGQDGDLFVPLRWAADGRLAGVLMSPTGRPTGIGVHDFRTHTTSRVADDPAYGAAWLAGHRRLAYFTNDLRDLVVTDTVTRHRTVIDVALPGPAINEPIAVSPDGRTIYYGAMRSQSDIWIVEPR